MESRKVIIIGIIVALALLLVVFLLRKPVLLEPEANARLDGRIFDVTAKVSGFIKKMDTQPDMFVSLDFPLLEIDSPDVRKEYEQAVASLISVEQGDVAPGSTMNVSVDMFEGRVDVAANNEAQAKKEYERLSIVYAEAMFNRRKAEANPKGYTKEYITQAKSLEENMKIGLTEASLKQEKVSLIRFRAEQELNSVKEQRRLLASPQGMEVLRAVELEAAKNRLATAEANVASLVVRAPVDGYVLEAEVKDGAKVAAGERLFRIVPLESKYLWLTVFFKEEVAANLLIGQECEIRFSALGQLPLTGKVVSIRPATLALPNSDFSVTLSNLENLVPVVVSLEDYDPSKMPQLRLGMSALVSPK